MVRLDIILGGCRCGCTAAWMLSEFKPRPEVWKASAISTPGCSRIDIEPARAIAFYGKPSPAGDSVRQWVASGMAAREDPLPPKGTPIENIPSHPISSQNVSRYLNLYCLSCRGSAPRLAGVQICILGKNLGRHLGLFDPQFCLPCPCNTRLLLLNTNRHSDLDFNATS